MTDVVAARKDPSALGARDLARAFAYATEWLGVHVDEVNALNVYPVPDGDTGTNMHLTMQSVRRQLSDENPKDMDAFAHALAYGSLLGARGNSGVILSQVLKGFADSVKGLERVGAPELADALDGARRCAYAAVMKPVEGTILTVVRRVAETAGADRSDADGPLDLLRRAREAGREALDRTPEQLPLLKQAGVVDAGGLGFLHVVDGILAFFEGRDLPPPPKIQARAQQQFEEEEFGFCTEFLLSDARASVREIQEMVAPFGDSLLVVGAEGYVKGHIHTEEPERLLATVARHGRMVRSKVEDMSEQHSEILADVDPGEAEAPTTALVAVSQGYGVTKVFRSLGARVVGGGQTNNPSVEDIADAVRSVGAKQVLVLPNNKNIVMAAQRVDDVVPDHDVFVLPTATLGQGLAAAVLFREDAEAEALIEEMRDAVEHALTLEVTTASRTVTIDEVAVQEGDFIGLADNRLVATAPTAADCLLALLDSRAEDYEIGTLFHNADVDGDGVEALVARIGERFPDLEIEVHAGGPDLYPYLMALE